VYGRIESMIPCQLRPSASSRVTEALTSRLKRGGSHRH
jgi:hypothetical protein